MKNWILIFALIVFLSQGLMAQGFRYYSQGDLSYADFKAEPLDIDSMIGSMYFKYHIQDTVLHIDNIDFATNLLHTGINVEQSWINIVERRGAGGIGLEDGVCTQCWLVGQGMTWSKIRNISWSTLHAVHVLCRVH